MALLMQLRLEGHKCGDVFVQRFVATMEADVARATRMTKLTEDVAKKLLLLDKSALRLLRRIGEASVVEVRAYTR